MNMNEAWHSELKEDIYKRPDKLTRECCAAIILGDLDSLNVDVHRLVFHGSYNLKVNYCFHCGKPLRAFRELIFKQLGLMLEQEMDHGNNH